MHHTEFESKFMTRHILSNATDDILTEQLTTGDVLLFSRRWTQMLVSSFACSSVLHSGEFETNPLVACLCASASSYLCMCRTKLRRGVCVMRWIPLENSGTRRGGLRGAAKQEASAYGVDTSLSTLRTVSVHMYSSVPSCLPALALLLSRCCPPPLPAVRFGVRPRYSKPAICVECFFT